MSKLKYFILKKFTGPLGLSILSIAFTHRLKRLVGRPVLSKVKSSFSVNNREITAQDLAIIFRLTKFWSNSQNSLTNLGESPWSQIQRGQTQFYEIMGEGNLEKIYDYLISSPTQSLCNGVLQGDRESIMLKANPKYRDLISKITINRFMALSEAIGEGCEVQNPEQGQWGVKKDFNFGEFLSRLDAAFGMPVIPPTVYTGLLLTEVGNRKFNQVDIMALNASLQIKNTLANSPNKTILEIGSGSGITPYWCNRLGLGPIQIIDLPHVAVLQAFYLLKSLPNANILLYGEEQGVSAPDITIYPHWAFLELPKNKVTLVFNQDSFAEMSNETVLNYLTWISDTSAQILLSINHESGATYDSSLASQANISKIIQESSAYLLLSRHPNWVRQGYIDQVWKIN
jgi:hypothetical protein